MKTSLVLSETGKRKMVSIATKITERVKKSFDPSFYALNDMAFLLLQKMAPSAVFTKRQSIFTGKFFRVFNHVIL